MPTTDDCKPLPAWIGTQYPDRRPHGSECGEPAEREHAGFSLEAFFKKFMEQAQNPVHTGIFVMTENALNKLIRIDFDPEILENYRIDPPNGFRRRSSGSSSRWTSRR